ncbi:MAG: ABC transporter permease [Anaerolineales bacterium]|nr:ABC transporter permease [Anaerolineales bacterium]
MNSLSVAGFLAVKEVWRNRGRFLLFSLVIALITILVLFIAALAEGLANSNREYLSKLDAQLVVLSDRADNLIAASRLGRTRVAAIRRTPGVEDAGAIAFANAVIAQPLPAGAAALPLRISLVGVEPGRPGEPRALEGRQLGTNLANEAVLDRGVVLRLGLQVGDSLVIQSTQGTKDEFFTLKVVGISDGQQYLFQPAVFVPLFTWDRIRPKGEGENSRAELTVNAVAVRAKNPAEAASLTDRLLNQVNDIDVLTIRQAYENLPGYSAQQSTLNTQQFFTLLIGVLVIGGFFQIQVLQKVPQIGVLKAIGASNAAVGTAAVLQIIIVTAFGVALGGLATLGLSAGLPATIPFAFTGPAAGLAIAALLLIGPLGGSVSIRYSVRIEPLKALGLSA